MLKHNAVDHDFNNVKVA